MPAPFRVRGLDNTSRLRGTNTLRGPGAAEIQDKFLTEAIALAEAQLVGLANSDIASLLEGHSVTLSLSDLVLLLEGHLPGASQAGSDQASLSEDASLIASLLAADSALFAEAYALSVLLLGGEPFSLDAAYTILLSTTELASVLEGYTLDASHQNSQAALLGDATLITVQSGEQLSLVEQSSLLSALQEAESMGFLDSPTLEALYALSDASSLTELVLAAAEFQLAVTLALLEMMVTDAGLTVDEAFSFLEAVSNDTGRAILHKIRLQMQNGIIRLRTDG